MGQRHQRHLPLRSFPVVSLAAFAAAFGAALLRQTLHPAAFVAGNSRVPEVCSPSSRSSRAESSVQLQAFRRKTKRIKIASNIATVREHGVRRFSNKLLQKQFRRVEKVAQDDAWVNEFLSYSRPTPVGGDYVIDPRDTKLILEKIYGDGPDLHHVDLGGEQEDSGLDEEEMDAMERVRRKPDPSKWPGASSRKARVRWGFVGGVSMPREVSTHHGNLGVKGGASAMDYQDCWVSGGTVAFDYQTEADY
eukprot:CAMPEP_0115106790 /NCGR_PEP_ID=MMETSP0227-20121206/36889_1 /TAXON_ID=89957 /ORGANISM="Polarella glacialis, Strain CCMP 1383" /LENGTH=248 /DNA_ID=CAMNT_0002504503 /DNA_START=57 /DNA_END=803 /DNA_ORIENTATION=+